MRLRPNRPVPERGQTHLRSSAATPDRAAPLLLALCIAACEYSQLLYVTPAASPLGVGDPALLALAGDATTRRASPENGPAGPWAHATVRATG